MKVEILNKMGKPRVCKVTKEPGDIVYRNGGFAGGNAGESRLLYHVKNILNKQGYDLIKKRMWKDGHMVDDRQQYLRARRKTGDTNKDIVIYNNSWTIRGAEVAFNEGGVAYLTVDEAFE